MISPEDARHDDALGAITSSIPNFDPMVSFITPTLAAMSTSLRALLTSIGEWFFAEDMGQTLQEILQISAWVTGGVHTMTASSFVFRAIA